MPAHLDHNWRVRSLQSLTAPPGPPDLRSYQGSNEGPKVAPGSPGTFRLRPADSAAHGSGRIEEQGATGVTLLHPETDYTGRLLAAVPVPDPVVQRRRRADRQAEAVPSGRPGAAAAGRRDREAAPGGEPGNGPTGKGISGKGRARCAGR